MHAAHFSADHNILHGFKKTAAHTQDDLSKNSICTTLLQNAFELVAFESSGSYK